MKRLSILIICLLWIQAMSAQNEQAQLADSARSDTVSIAIAEILPTIAKEAMNIEQKLLPEVQRNVVHPNQIQIDSLQMEVGRLGTITSELILDNQGYSFYESLNLKWSELINNLEKIEAKLLDYSTEIERVRTNLDIQKLRWEITGSSIKDLEYAENMVQPIGKMIRIIDSALHIVQDSLHYAISAQQRTTVAILEAKTNLASVQQLKDEEIGYILTLKDPPLWRISSQSDSTALVIDIDMIQQFRMEDSKLYLKNNWYVLLILVLLYLVLALFLRWLRKEHHKIENSNKEQLKQSLFVISMPYVAAWMFSTLLILVFFHATMPLLIAKAYALLFLIPFLVVFHGAVIKALRWSLFYFVILFIFSNIPILFAVSEVSNRLIQLFLTIAIGGFFVWFVIQGKRLKSENEDGRLFYSFLKTFSPWYLVVQCCALIVNIIGYGVMAELINFGTIISITMALILGTAYTSLVTLIYIFIQTRPAQHSNLVRESGMSLYRGLKKVLWLLTIYYWVKMSLDGYHVWDPVVAWLVKIWETGYQFGTFHVSIGDIISFILIIVFSWIIAWILKHILQKEVLLRFNMARGVPNAVSSLLYYFLVVSGFMLALAYIGFDLSNLGLLAGAMGFGIGFGLQSLIGNFIAGLILAFERPVTVGDWIFVDGLEGRVIKMGIRTSVIRQFDGSQLIIPNADLVNNKVTNWSLTKFRKRYIITVHAHLDSDPDFVLKTIDDAVKKVDGVLTDPAAATYFRGVVERALEFAVYFWASENLFEVQSNVNLAIQKAIDEANIVLEIPLPLKMDPLKETGESIGGGK